MLSILFSPIALGGPGAVVEIDESSFVCHIYHVGHDVNTQWVFGGIEVNLKNCFLVAVENRTAAMLLPIIQQYILPGTTVVSDLWCAYNTVGNLGYIHLTVNHSIHFVDPVTQATMNHVECMWARAKQRNKRENGTLRTSLDSYLIEFM